MRGPLADPNVSVNPLAALTPGFLRGIFGIGQSEADGAGPAQGGRAAPRNRPLIRDTPWGIIDA